MRIRGGPAAYDRVATRLLAERQRARPPPARRSYPSRTSETTRSQGMGIISSIKTAAATIRQAAGLRNFVASQPDLGNYEDYLAGKYAAPVEGLDYETGVPGRTEAGIQADYQEGRIDRGEYERQVDARYAALEAHWAAEDGRHVRAFEAAGHEPEPRTMTDIT